MGMKKNIAVIGGIYHNATITIINAIKENNVLKKEKQIFEIGKIVTGSLTFLLVTHFLLLKFEPIQWIQHKDYILKVQLKNKLEKLQYLI